MSRVDPPSVVNIADLRDAAKKRLPKVVFDYIDGGADAEWTLRENVRVFDDGIAFRCVVPGEGSRVPDEATAFVLPAGATVWYHDLHGHYEGSC